MKTALAIILLPLLTFLPSQSIAAQCQLDPNMLKASYQLNASQAHSKTHKNQHTTEVILWRQGKTVAHQYPHNHITESWYLLDNQQIKPTRYFDKYQRAIEYQPGESVHGKKEADWGYRHQLISSDLLSQLTLIEETGQGCERQQVYALKSNSAATPLTTALTTESSKAPHVSIKLTWLPALQIFSQFTWQKGHAQQTWTLLGVEHNSRDIKQFFSQRQQYQSTDYADIGDDHSDTFLTNMVSLGFVEHGASGFYDTNGNALASSNQHNH